MLVTKLARGYTRYDECATGNKADPRVATDFKLNPSILCIHCLKNSTSFEQETAENYRLEVLEIPTKTPHDKNPTDEIPDDNIPGDKTPKLLNSDKNPTFQ